MERRCSGSAQDRWNGMRERAQYRHTHIQIYIGLHTRVHNTSNTYIYINMYMYTSACIHTYAKRHTYIHTHIYMHAPIKTDERERGESERPTGKGDMVGKRQRDRQRDTNRHRQTQRERERAEERKGWGMKQWNNGKRKIWKTEKWT